MAGFGISFAPTAQNQQEQQNQHQTPIQDAIRLLSLRIPSFAGSRSPIPDALLQAPGGAGLGMATAETLGGLDQWLRRLFASAGASPFAPGRSVPDMPAMPPPIPRVTPASIPTPLPTPRNPDPPPRNPGPGIMILDPPPATQPPRIPQLPARGPFRKPSAGGGDLNLY
jgi:hypothetical protein